MRFILNVVFLILLQSWITLQNVIQQNYTSKLLRASKASHIKAFLNEDVQPCSDFYSFACGKWSIFQPAIADTTIRGKTASLQELEELYVWKSGQMLKSDGNIDSSVEIKLKDFYQSCRHEKGVRKLNLDAVIQLAKFKGGWPAVESVAWYEDEYDWLKVISDLRRELGVNIMVGMEVIPDLEDINTYRIKVGAPKLHLVTKDAYLKDDQADRRENYRRDIENKLQLFFPHMPSSWAYEVADQVLHVEQQLALGLPDDNELALKQNSRLRSAADLRAAYGSYVDLSRYLNLVFNQTIYVKVYESPLDFMPNLVNVIRDTPKLTIANYTMWRMLEHVDFAGEVNRPDNDIWCVHKTMEYFSKPLETLFYRNYNTMPLVNEIQSVWSDIKRTFREQLQTSAKLNWLTQDVRQKAVIKLDAMELEFMSHEYDNFAQEMYDFHFRRNAYYENLIEILKRQTQRNLAKLVEQPKSDEDLQQIKLPRYEVTKNKIFMPITMLQARFFWDASYPHALKYSTIGFLLAKEMIRGFDAIGRRYDVHGYQRTWWDTTSEWAFTERARCFDEQYAKYKYRGKDLSGIAMQSTTIPDNGGLSIAYETYQKWWQFVADKELSAMESMPLLQYNKNQLFFIGFAQLWCADYPHHLMMEQINEVPESIRVNGAVANSVNFAREFKCNMASPMNPELKCNIY